MNNEQVQDQNPEQAQQPESTPQQPDQSVVNPTEPDVLPDGLPEDAVRTPDELNTLESQPQDQQPPVDEDELKRIEEEVDQAMQASITPPADQQQQQEPTLEQRLANIESYLTQGAPQQQVPAQQQVPKQDQYTTGAQESYNNYGDDPYTQEPQQQQQADPQFNQISQQLQQTQDWLGVIYQKQQEQEQWRVQQEEQRQRDQQAEQMRNKYDVDDNTINRANWLMKQGRGLEAFELIEGRSRSQGATNAMREQRAEARDLAGTPTMPAGNAQQSGPATDLEAAKTAYEAARAMPAGPGKDMAFIKFRQDYPDSARLLMEGAIGGPLVTDAQTVG